MMYQQFVFIHLLLFVFWFGGDLGVFVLGQQSRRSSVYSLQERLTLLKVLVMVDMGPRTCIAFMVPISLTIAHMGGWWLIPKWLLGAGWLIGGVLLWAAWTSFLKQGEPIAQTAKTIDFWVQVAMIAFYGGIGVFSLATGDPIVHRWLAFKTLLYSLIFVMAVMIDISYRPIGPALQKLISEGSSPETEAPVLAIQNRTRKWVLSIYVLLFAIGYVGVTKPF